MTGLASAENDSSAAAAIGAGDPDARSGNTSHMARRIAKQANATISNMLNLPLGDCALVRYRFRPVTG